ncbi:hypothetical protein [Azospirillum brasilense]|uniref:hypothetical protein n=1 Tax=Azospirillum brasilense TaxID=192 RepID=UPI000E0C3697|nr:hypothetical protein [Azospirillum brasilense]
MTVSSLEIIIEGDDPQPAAADFAALIESFGAEATAQVLRSDAASNEARRVIDPIALTALVVSIPSAVLAVLQLGDRVADRMEKRRRAKQLLESARQICDTGKVEFLIVGEDGPRSLIALSADDLLDLAEAKERDATSRQ